MINSASIKNSASRKLLSKLMKLLLILISAAVLITGLGFLYEAIASASAKKIILHRVD